MCHVTWRVVSPLCTPSLETGFRWDPRLGSRCKRRRRLRGSAWRLPLNCHQLTQFAPGARGKAPSGAIRIGPVGRGLREHMGSSLKGHSGRGLRRGGRATRTGALAIVSATGAAARAAQAKA